MSGILRLSVRQSCSCARPTTQRLWEFCLRDFYVCQYDSHANRYFTDRCKVVLLLWIFYVFVLSCVCYVLCASVYMCYVVTCWERADLLALVCGVYCEFVTFPLVSWVRCGTLLYRFLIFAPLLTSSAKIQDTNILSWKSEYDLEKLTETSVSVSAAHTKSVLCYTVLR